VVSKALRAAELGKGRSALRQGGDQQYERHSSHQSDNTSRKPPSTSRIRVGEILPTGRQENPC
jgi:hypothetical protein